MRRRLRQRWPKPTQLARGWEDRQALHPLLLPDPLQRGDRGMEEVIDQDVYHQVNTMHRATGKSAANHALCQRPADHLRSLWIRGPQGMREQEGRPQEARKDKETGGGEFIGEKSRSKRSSIISPHGSRERQVPPHRHSLWVSFTTHV